MGILEASKTRKKKEMEEAGGYDRENRRSFSPGTQQIVPKQAPQELQKHTTSTIKQPVSDLDSIIHGISTSRIGNLPETKANLWHIMTSVQFNGSHFRRFVCDCSREGEVRGEGLLVLWWEV